jgi:hypothetical protein
LNNSSTPAAATSSSNGPVKRVALVFLSGVLLFAAAEALIFHSGAYTPFLEPNSYAGQFELLRNRELNRAPDDRRNILLLGDSRIAEGFSEQQAEEFGGSQNIRVLSGALMGSTPRVWSYLLREVDPDRNRYSIVLVPVWDYSDIDHSSYLADRLSDLRMLITSLGLRDIPEFASSYEGPGRRTEVTRSIILKGSALQPDLLGFLKDPAARLSKIQQYRQHWVQWRFEYAGREGSVEGLEISPTTGEVIYPSSAGPSMMRSIDSILRPSDQDGAVRRYREKWLTKIVDYYQGSRTQVFFVPIPRGPLVPQVRLPQEDAVVRVLGQQAHVRLLPESLFSYLEHPQYFQDALHLNRRGRHLFTETLVKSVLDTLQPDSGTPIQQKKTEES